ncbi:hypothetical protein GYMLUDRAFT_364676 [Collybiopsis luxurians FD-317 M1]|nr:hypothetical protein GYMLUDRAFT_364676 [Collybiopsis luxurians FD-317 M1]
MSRSRRGIHPAFIPPSSGHFLSCLSCMSEQSEEKTDTSRKTQARARVWRACEVCRKRKVKCNGQEPCSYCISSGKLCSFKDINDNAASARQQTNSVDVRLAKVEETVQKLLPMAEAFDAWMRANSQAPVSAFPFRTDLDTTPLSSQSRHPSVSPRPVDRFSPPSTSYRASNAIKELCVNEALEQGFTPQDNADYPDERASYGPEKWSDRSSHLSKDSYGHLRYTGGASSFMLVDALTSLQNDDPTAIASPESTLSTKAEIRLPFFAPNKTFRKQAALPRPEDILYPPPELADELVAIYFAKIHHTFPILHQQTFAERYMKVMEQKAKGKPSKDHGFLSALFAVFACGACLIEKGRSKSEQGENGEFRGFEFYEKAQLFFWMGVGSSQIEHVQCISIMAICNATWNTLAQSWINVGAAIRRAQDLGLHLSGRRLPITPFEREYRRRVWWCVYGLDRVLSIALGRPSGTHEDDFDVEMPSELDDAQLSTLRDGISTHPIMKGKTYMTGFVALLGIYVIAGKIMRFAQSSHIEDAKSERTKKTIRDLDSELYNWIHRLPPEVRFAANNSTNSKMLALCLIAFFVYYSAIINLHRPFIPDHLTSSSDLTSLGQCLTAARSCIRIGEITQEMLPASHHLAFAVQYITLSAVLLLRSITYVNQEDLVSAIISDAEKAIKILEGMEAAWPASKRCREIVSDLLVVVRTKVYGGASAIEALQAAQRRYQDPQQESMTTGIKRKRGSEPGPVPSSSRQRLEDREWTSAGPSGSSDKRYLPPLSTLSQNADDEHYSNSMRTSSIRTSMPSDSPLTPNDILRSHVLSNVRGESSVPDPHLTTKRDTQFFGGSIQSHSSGSHTSEPPQISLDINALSTSGSHGIDEYSGYDFLRGELSALLGTVMRPFEQPSPQTFEESAHLLRQAFHSQPDGPFVA